MIDTIGCCDVCGGACGDSVDFCFDCQKYPQIFGDDSKDDDVINTELPLQLLFLSKATHDRL